MLKKVKDLLINPFAHIETTPETVKQDQGPSDDVQANAEVEYNLTDEAKEKNEAANFLDKFTDVVMRSPLKTLLKEEVEKDSVEDAIIVSPAKSESDEDTDHLMDKLKKILASPFKS